MNSTKLATLLDRHTEGWTSEQRAALISSLEREARRQAVSRRYPSAGALAQHIDDTTVQTPAMRVIDDAFEWALQTPNARLIVTIPPQQGKSTRLSVWGVLRAIVQDPERRVVVASYSESLARHHVRTARNIVRIAGSDAKDPITGARLPDRLGYALADDQSASASWKIAGHAGGCFAVGVGGSLTGKPAELLIIDDPIKGMAEADSTVEREKVITWWQSVAQTRLAPGAPVVIVQTRWHEQDLAGHLLSIDESRPEDEREWRVINIPAIATEGVPDALNRAPGEPLESTRGHTLDDWLRIREQVGPRVWSALYLGTPTPGEGGLFSQDWFDRYRLPRTPDNVAARIVSVDPAETGHGDEAGIIALSATADGRVAVTDDRSERLQSHEWARQAVLLALETGAGEVLFEAFTTGPTYERVIRQAWTEVRDAARARDDGHDSALDLSGIAVPDQDDPPFVIKPWRAKGDKTARAAGTRQAASTGRLRMVGTHPKLETQAATWQQGQTSPDRLDALVNGFERCMQLVGSRSIIAVPVAPAEPAPRARRGFSWGSSMPSGL